MIRVVLVDDEPIVRSGIAMLLSGEADIEVIADVDGGPKAVDLVVRERPDVVITDVRMPGMDGVEMTRRIVAATSEQLSVTNEQLLAKGEQLPVTDERLSVADRRLSVADRRRSVMGLQPSATGEQRSASGDQLAVTNGRAPATREQPSVTDWQPSLVGWRRSATSEQLSAPGEPSGQPSATGERLSAPREQTPGTGDRNYANQVKVLVLTTFHVDKAVYAALRAGASGFILKDAAPTELVAAVRAIAAGEAWLDPAVARKLIDEFASRPESGVPGAAELQSLTNREREVLVLVAHGMSNAEISDYLVVGEGTTKTHISRIFAKLGFRDRAQAVATAFKCGLIRPEDPMPSRPQRRTP